MRGQRFAVLLCAQDPDYVKKKYGGYFEVYLKMLAEEGETWDVYRALYGEFPDDDQIESYDGYVITGSRHYAHDNDVWICRLLSLVKELDSMKKKVLGICFGHQMIARALGAKIGRSIKGWDVGVTAVHLSSSAARLFSSLKLPAVLSILECHRDEIWELPAKAEVIGCSKHSGIEMFRYGDHMLGIQGHPEYTKDILHHLIDRLIKAKMIANSHAEEARARVDEIETDREAWKKLCVSFLKSRL